MSGVLLLYYNPIEKIQANLGLLPLRILNLNGRNIILHPSRVENLQEVMHEHLKDTSTPFLREIIDKQYYFLSTHVIFNNQLRGDSSSAQTTFDTARGTGTASELLYMNYVSACITPPENPFFHEEIDELESIHEESLSRGVWNPELATRYFTFLSSHNAHKKIIDSIESIKAERWLKEPSICAFYLSTLIEMGITEPDYFAKKSIFEKAQPIYNKWLDSRSINNQLWEAWYTLAWNEKAYSEICRTFDYRGSAPYAISVPICAIYLKACGHAPHKTLQEIEEYYKIKRGIIYNDISQANEAPKLDTAFEYAKKTKKQESLLISALFKKIHHMFSSSLD
jgi:hypothetical protein